MKSYDAPCVNVTQVNGVHPGAVGTRIGNLGGGLGIIGMLVEPLLPTPEKGALTDLHVATDTTLKALTGRYFKRSAGAHPNPLAVWSRSEALVGTTAS